MGPSAVSQYTAARRLHGVGVPVGGGLSGPGTESAERARHAGGMVASGCARFHMPHTPASRRASEATRPTCSCALASAACGWLTLTRSPSPRSTATAVPHGPMWAFQRRGAWRGTFTRSCLRPRRARACVRRRACLRLLFSGGREVLRALRMRMLGAQHAPEHLLPAPGAVRARECRLLCGHARWDLPALQRLQPPPALQVEVVNAMCTEDSLEELLTGDPDFVFDAIDNIDTKASTALCGIGGRGPALRRALHGTARRPCRHDCLTAEMAGGGWAGACLVQKEKKLACSSG